MYYSGGNGPHSGARSDFIALATAPTHAVAGLRTLGGEARVLETAAVLCGVAQVSLLASVPPGGQLYVAVRYEKASTEQIADWIEVSGQAADGEVRWRDLDLDLRHQAETECSKLAIKASRAILHALRIRVP